MGLYPYGGDWLDVDDSDLPTNQLPLLRSMFGRRLIDIQRSISGLPDEYVISHRDFFRKGSGIIIFDLEDLPQIYFDDLKYDRHEISIAVSSKPPHEFGRETFGLARRYTLRDREYVDDNLYNLFDKRIIGMRILIRKPDLPRDKGQALQSGIEMSFDNNTIIIISYFLNEQQGRLFQILYPEEIPWDFVQYTVDVSKGRIPWRYRFNRWKWRALNRLESRFD